MNAVATTPNPEAVTFAKRADALLEVAQSYEIVDATMRDMASAELRQVVTMKKTVDEKRKYYVEPHLEGQRRVNGDFMPIIKRLEEVESVLKRKLIAFEEAERKRRHEAEAAARRQAEEAARKLREEAEARAAEQRRQAEEAAKAGDVGAAAAAAAEAENTVAAAETQIEAVTSAAIAAPVAQAPRSAGIGIRENWQAEVTDVHALIAAAAANPAAFAMYLQPNEQALRATAKATKGVMTIPGVRIFDAGSVSARRVGG